MKILIITVAGMSTRFSASVGRETVKCLYHKGDFSSSLLYSLIHMPVPFDRYVIVGGYRFDELSAAVKEHFPELSEKISLVNNEHFGDLGSGYSLYLGLTEALSFSPDEIVFAEGDLHVDTASYVRFCNSEKSAVTYNPEPITAEKAVAFYFDAHGKIRYIYDTGHSALVINEPFTAIYNSGQMWKFSDISLVEKIMASMSEEEFGGTNLVFTEKYFRALDGNYDLIGFNDWINCNTVQDFDRIQGDEHLS